MARCKAKIRAGRQCKRNATDGDFCSSHRPAEPVEPAPAEPVVESATVPAVDALVEEDARLARGEEPSPLMRLEAAVFQMARLLTEQNERLITSLEQDRRIWREQAEKADKRAAEMEKRVMAQISKAHELAGATPPEVKRKAQAELAAKLQAEVQNQAAQATSDLMQVKDQLARELATNPITIWSDKYETLVIQGVRFRLVPGQQQVPESVALLLTWRNQLAQAHAAMSQSVRASSAGDGPATRPGENVPRALQEAEREHGLGQTTDHSQGFEVLDSIPVNRQV